MKTRLLAGAIAALLTACSGGGASRTIPPTSVAPAPLDGARTEASVHAEPPGGGLTMLSAFTAQDNATGTLVHILPPRDAPAAFNAAEPAATPPNLAYHNGPVQTAPKLYVVFWGSSWNTTTGDPKGVAAKLKSFYAVIGGSKWLNSVKQYTQRGGLHVGNSGNIFGGSMVDTGSTPPRNPSQSQMAVEAARGAAHFHDYSANASYVVAMPHGIVPQGGFGSIYCAYHSSASAAGHTIAWTNLPYLPDAGAGCGLGSVNRPGTLDGVTIVGGHEQAETETDPFPNSGWLDATGAENGDKCAWIQLENNPFAGGFPTQPLWSNSGSHCVQSA